MGTKMYLSLPLFLSSFSDLVFSKQTHRKLGLVLRSHKHKHVRRCCRSEPKHPQSRRLVTKPDAAEETTGRDQRSVWNIQLLVFGATKVEMLQHWKKNHHLKEEMTSVYLNKEIKCKVSEGLVWS